MCVSERERESVCVCVCVCVMGYRSVSITKLQTWEYCLILFFSIICVFEESKQKEDLSMGVCAICQSFHYKMTSLEIVPIVIP